MKRILAALLLLTLAAPAWGQDYDRGIQAYERGDYATALREIEPLAERGDGSAQYLLGVMYRKGQGVPQDYAEAAKWFRKAAEQGNAGAQFALGFMYDNGWGVPQNYAKAIKWYRKAAEQGDAQAQFNLGFMYGFGLGVPQDYVQAHMWYNLAASRFAPGPLREVATRFRDITAKYMTPAQIAEAQRLAREWKPKGRRDVAK